MGGRKKIMIGGGSDAQEAGYTWMQERHLDSYESMTLDTGRQFRSMRAVLHENLRTLPGSWMEDEENEWEIFDCIRAGLHIKCRGASALEDGGNSNL